MYWVRVQEALLTNTDNPKQKSETTKLEKISLF